MFSFFVFATKPQYFSVVEVSVENYICIMHIHMQETHKYSILEEKHVTLQIGSSIDMKKKKGNFNQGFSRLDMHLMKKFKYFSSFEQA